MSRHLMIAALFVGTGALLGSGVVNLQLWRRSHEAETRVIQLQEQLQTAQAESSQTQRELQKLNDRYLALQASETRLEAENDHHLGKANDLGIQLVQYEAQYGELRRAADRAVALSEQVVQLQQELMELKQNGTQPGSGQLVRVEKPDPPVEKPDPPFPASKEYDDRGWKSVSPAGASPQP